MALKATIFKADLNISDTNRHYYHEHQLTIARHPSETDERMMIRLLAFALNASDSLSLTKGISTDDEPDLWQKDLSDHIEIWIDLGQPEEKRIRKACGRSSQVIIYPYNPRSATIWWDQNSSILARFENLSVTNLVTNSSTALSELVQRNMQLQCTIQGDDIWLSNDDKTIEINLQHWK